MARNYVKFNISKAATNLAQIFFSQYSSPDPSTEINESYSLHQMRHHGHSDAPNSSLGPTYDMVANVDEAVHTYDVIGQKQ